VETQRRNFVWRVYQADGPHVDLAIFNLGIPVLGLCYGLQEIEWHHGKNVIASTGREYDHAELKAQRYNGHVDPLFKDDIKVWMSHGDKLSAFPANFHTIATTKKPVRRHRS